MSPSSSGRVFVVGSINQDLVLEVPGLPRPGETVLGSGELRPAGGGKGANQAVAAARCRADTLMVGCVGRDPAGDALSRELGEAGVDVSRVTRVSVATGTAVVAVDPAGENTILVAPGANLACDHAFVTDALHGLSAHDIVVAQAEIPLDGLRAASDAARRARALLVLNLAPVPEEVDLHLPARCVLIVNEHEARTLYRQRGVAQDPATLAASLGTTLVVTRGSRGVVVLEPGTAPVHHSAVPVGHPVDTTGAGDAFVGAFAAALAQRETLTTAVGWGTSAGSIAVETAGARSDRLTLEVVVARMEGHDGRDDRWAQPGSD